MPGAALRLLVPVGARGVERELAEATEEVWEGFAAVIDDVKRELLAASVEFGRDVPGARKVGFSMSG